MNNRNTKITVLNRIKKLDFIHLTTTISLGIYLSFAITNVALASVAKFHSLEESKSPASL